MPDDKPQLTRRGALGGIATIGAAGAVGSSAWARFTDKERKIITAEAGRLDLQFKDFYPKDSTWGEWMDGPVRVDLGVLKNGQRKHHCELLRNNGTVPANELSLEIPRSSIVQRENTRYKQEVEAGDTTTDRGELLRFIKVTAFFICKVSGGYKAYPCYGGDVQDIETEAASVEELVMATEDGETEMNGNIVYDQLGPVWLREALDRKAQVDLHDGVLKPDGDKCLFCLVFELTEPDGYDNANIAQSDRLEFGVDVELAQDTQNNG